MKLANISGPGAGVGLVLPFLHSYPQPPPACVCCQLLELVSGPFGQVSGGRFRGSGDKGIKLAPNGVEFSNLISIALRIDLARGLEENCWNIIV
jgi:hypothetical protein